MTAPLELPLAFSFEVTLLVQNHTALCDALDKGLQQLSNTITERYFSHATRQVR